MKHLLALIALVLALVPATAYADSKSYFIVRQGDVFAGGWFNTAATGCSTSDANYQAPVNYNSSDQYKGGILAFATSDRQGSGTDFGALAMGLIEGNSGSSYGFYSGPSGTSTLSFSNTNNVTGSYWGGYLAGSTPQTHCVPDYYNTKQNSPSNLGVQNSINLGTLASGQYRYAQRRLGQYYA